MKAFEPKDSEAFSCYRYMLFCSSTATVVSPE